MANKRDYEPHETRRHKTVPTRPIPLSRPRIPETHTDHLTLPDHIRGMREALEREALERQHAIDGIATAPLPHRPTQEEIETLKRCWLAMPTWDIEFSVGFELVTNELAGWHDDQIAEKAARMGCSHLMSSILEELVRCWIHGCAPSSPLALRVLASYR